MFYVIATDALQARPRLACDPNRSDTFARPTGCLSWPHCSLYTLLICQYMSLVAPAVISGMCHLLAGHVQAVNRHRYSHSFSVQPLQYYCASKREVPNRAMTQCCTVRKKDVSAEALHHMHHLSSPQTRPLFFFSSLISSTAPPQ